MNIAATTLRQRADYTHKHNVKTGRHGWLRLTPAYSVKMVEEIISSQNSTVRIFDPFCGTATTALSAAYHGHHGITTDINPFLVWLGNVKTARYDLISIEGTRHACRKALDLVKKRHVEPVAAPLLHNIERWWSPSSLEFLTTLYAAIDEVSEPHSAQRNLLLVSFCRTLIAASNAAFNHQSMSFKDSNQVALALDLDLMGLFASDVSHVLTGAADNPLGTADISLCDARCPNECITEPVDLVVTSPPYVNRMSYIRELRPYMYWLGFLTNARQAGELDWEAIGGTWGIATSRLTEWKKSTDSFVLDVLDDAVDKIAHVENKNGKLLANYVSKYFDDMWNHFCGLTPVLATDAKIHYIVGNSTFYGTLLPVEEIYAAMLRKIGFAEISCRAIRKRNSKKELIEFDVSAVWPS